MTKSEFMTFHKYFIHADRMRVLFEAELQKKQGKPRTNIDVEEMMFLVLWYGCLYVVVEGWQTLKLSDPKIDHLLKSKNVGLLKGCRHDTFHFQRKYLSNRTLRFIDEKGTPSWVRELTSEFGNWFLRELKGTYKS